MKLLHTTIGLAITSAVLAAVAVTGSNARAAKSPATAPSTQPINKFCAVEQENKIDPKGGTYVYNGKVIGFCCPDCVDEFKKDPEKYMKTIK